MPQNIEEIIIADESYKKNGIRPVMIKFKFPCTWTLLGVSDLKQILRKWIEGEEEKYPREKGFEGRWMLFDEIKRVFDE